MKKLFPLIWLIILGACEKETIDPNEPPVLEPLSRQEEQLVEASNDFALELTAKVNEQEAGNFFISPLSVGYALGMTFNGAAGSTKDGIRQTLDFGNLTDEEINKSFKELTDVLTGMDKRVIMNIANSIWYRNDLNVKEAFAQAVSQYYNAGVTDLDFSAPTAKDVINGWIEEKTEGKIRDMLDAIPPNAVMYLVNAIYFKANWTYQFDKDKTSEEIFYLENGGTVTADMMFSEGTTIALTQRNDFRYLEIPYGNKQFSMAVLAPRDGVTVDEVFETLDSQGLKTLSEEADTLTLRLRMPKFKMDYKLKLNTHLSGMGMAEAFSDAANLSELFEEELSLAISRVLHQSFVEVNEEGSEAAAATIVEIIETSAPSEPNQINLNKPFIFFIKEKHTNTILFVGKMMNPSI